MPDVIHEPAMQKIGTSEVESWVKALRELAVAAEESNANTAAMTFSWLGELEEIDALYVPEITLRVKKPTS